MADTPLEGALVMYPGDDAPELRPTRHVNVEFPCQEQADILNAMIYIPCGRPTDGRKFIHTSGEGPYFFCDLHRDHNLKRGFKEVSTDG
jgi:hypothetical protein